tara:strand:- start:272 stop:664 length:393 start_codon:yes stop_codon:yes gene_type:complete
MNKQQKEIADAKANIAKRKAEIADIAPIGKGGGGIAQSMVLSLTDNALSDRGIAPRQVQLVIAYLHLLGGTATVKQIDDFSVTAEGRLAWLRADGTDYEQTPSKILRTYISKMKGDDAWNKSNGKNALVS